MKNAFVVLTLLLGLAACGDQNEKVAESEAAAPTQQTTGNVFEKASNDVFIETNAIVKGCDEMMPQEEIAVFDSKPMKCAELELADGGELARVKVSGMFGKNQVSPWDNHGGGTYTTIVAIDDNHLMTIWQEDQLIMTIDE